MATQAEMKAMLESGASQAEMAAHLGNGGGYNGSSSAATVNQGSGGGSPHETNTYAAAPVVTPPSGGSPHETNTYAAAPENTSTTTTSGGNTTTTNNNYIKNDYDDTWITDWADTLNTSFGDSFKEVNEGLSSNYKLIGDNASSITDNSKATGLQIKGLEGDYKSLFGDVGDVEDSIDDANADIKDLGLDFSDLDTDLTALGKVQDKYGLNLTDAEGNIVDLEKDIIANEKTMASGQKADEKARTAQDSAVEKALKDVDYQFGDVTKAQTALEKDTTSSFKLANDSIDDLSSDLDDWGLDMDNIAFGLGEDIESNADSISDNAAYAKEVEEALTKAEEALETSKTDQGKVDQSILDKMEKYNTSQDSQWADEFSGLEDTFADSSKSVKQSFKEASDDLDSATKTLNETITKETDGAYKNAQEYSDAIEKGLIKENEEINKALGAYSLAQSDFQEAQAKSDTAQDSAWAEEFTGLEDTFADNKKDTDDQILSVGEEAEKYASDASTARDKLKKAIELSTDGKFKTINEYVAAVEKGEVKANDHIMDLMEAYDAAQTKSLTTSQTDQAKSDEAQDKEWAGEFSGLEGTVADNKTDQGKVDQSILDKMKEYNTSQTESLETSKTDQGKVDQSIIDKMAEYNNAQTKGVEANAKAIEAGDKKADSIITDTYKARKELLTEISKYTDGKITSIKDYMDALESGEVKANEEIMDLMESLDKAQTKALEESNKDNKEANDAQDEAGQKQDKYDQKYWSNRLKTLKASGMSESDVQNQLKQEMSILKDKTYSGDAVVTAEDQNTAWEGLMGVMKDFGLDAHPNAPKEYLYEMTTNNLDQWVKDGKVTVTTSTSGMFDENTTSVYTLPNGQQIIKKSSDYTVGEGDDQFSLGDNTDTLYMNGIELGSSKGGITTIVEEGYANHVDSTVNVGADTNPNSEGNSSTGGGNAPVEEEVEVVEEEVEEEETDPVVGDDIPLPKDLTDPEGDGAYGQDGRAFSLDGVTYWKRIKDRNGRWTYTRLDSYQNQGTSSRRQGWGDNVQNF
jgi:hypothetical protein